MKTGLITAAAIASVMVLSATAFADGDSCPSKKGAHKDMSAAVSKDGKDHHGWVAAQDAAKVEESAVSSTEAKQTVPAQPTKGALKI